MAAYQKRMIADHLVRTVVDLVRSAGRLVAKDNYLVIVVHDLVKPTCALVIAAADLVVRPLTTMQVVPTKSTLIQNSHNSLYRDAGVDCDAYNRKKKEIFIQIVV